MMGAAATPLAFGEIYTALQAGVLDGLEHDPPTVLASKSYETAKFYALTEHIFSPLVLYFSDATFKRMDPKLRDEFLDAAQRAAAAHRAYGLAAEQEALGVLKSSGVMVIPCDKAAFRKRVLPQTEAFLRRMPEAKPVVDHPGYGRLAGCPTWAGRSTAAPASCWPRWMVLLPGCCSWTSWWFPLPCCPATR